MGNNHEDVERAFKARIFDALKMCVDELRPIAIAHGFTYPNAYICGWIEARTKEILRSFLEHESEKEE